MCSWHRTCLDAEHGISSRSHHRSNQRVREGGEVDEIIFDIRNQIWVYVSLLYECASCIDQPLTLRFWHRSSSNRSGRITLDDGRPCIGAEMSFEEYESACIRADAAMKESNGHRFVQILKTRCMNCGRSPNTKGRCGGWFTTYLYCLSYELTGVYGVPSQGVTIK